MTACQLLVSSRARLGRREGPERGWAGWKICRLKPILRFLSGLISSSARENEKMRLGRRLHSSLWFPGRLHVSLFSSQRARAIRTGDEVEDVERQRLVHKSILLVGVLILSSSPSSAPTLLRARGKDEIEECRSSGSWVPTRHSSPYRARDETRGCESSTY